MPNHRSDDETPYWWRQWREDSERAAERADRDAMEYRLLVLEELKDLRASITQGEKDARRLELEWTFWKGRVWGVAAFAATMIHLIAWVAWKLFYK